jgi:subtilisin family serine protease
MVVRPPTGRGVRIAVVDSGVHAAHPHVGSVAGGVGIDDDGREYDDYVDRLGHGTAVAAAIREKAPDAEIYAVKVFDRSLSTRISALVAAIDWSAANGMHLVNLSLGTARMEHERVLTEAIARAAALGLAVCRVWSRSDWTRAVHGTSTALRASGAPPSFARQGFRGRSRGCRRSGI